MHRAHIIALAAYAVGTLAVIWLTWAVIRIRRHEAGPVARMWLRQAVAYYAWPFLLMFVSAALAGVFTVVVMPAIALELRVGGLAPGAMTMGLVHVGEWCQRNAVIILGFCLAAKLAAVGWFVATVSRATRADEQRM